jgi:hypothetical protein
MKKKCAIRNTDDKTRSFEIPESMILDSEMDEFLIERMIKEANEYEKKLNDDPQLKEVAAPDDLYDKIKACIKENSRNKSHVNSGEVDKNLKENQSFSEMEYLNLSKEELENVKEGETIRDLTKNSEILKNFLKQTAEKKDKPRKNRKKKIKHFWNIQKAAITILAFVGSLWIGLSSEANCLLIINSIEKIFSNKTELHSDRQESGVVMSEEGEAYLEVKNNLNSDFYMEYKSEELKFEKYKINGAEGKLICGVDMKRI